MIGQPTPWMATIQAVWRERYPSGAAPALAAKALRGLVARIGIESVTARLRVYLRAVPPMYINLFNFASTSDAYEPTPPLTGTAQCLTSGELQARYGGSGDDTPT